MDINEANQIAKSLIDNIEEKDLSYQLFNKLCEFLNSFSYYHQLPDSYIVAKAFGIYIATHKNKNSQEEEVRMLYSLSLLIKALKKTSDITEKCELLVLVSTLLTVKFKIIHIFLYYTLSDDLIDNEEPKIRQIPKEYLDIMLNNYYSIKHYIYTFISSINPKLNFHIRIWDLYNKKNKTIIEKITSGDCSYNSRINGEYLLFKCFHNYSKYNTIPLYTISVNNSWINIKTLGLIKSDVELWSDKYVLDEFNQERMLVISKCSVVFISFNSGKLHIDISDFNTFKNLIGEYEINNIIVDKLESKTTILLKTDPFNSPTFIPYEINIFSCPNYIMQVIITSGSKLGTWSTVRFIL